MPDRHPNEIAMEKEQAEYLKNIDAITKARNTPHPNQVAAEEERAAQERAAARAARQEARQAETPASAAPVAHPEKKDGE